MQSFRVPDDAKHEVERLADMQLTDVGVALFHVVLSFTSRQTRWVQVNKPFQFRLGDELWRDCDPTAVPNGGMTGDTEFIRLVG